MRPSRVIRRMLVMSLALMFAFPPAVSSAQGAKGAPIKIGACLSLTGAGAGLGIPERNGMQLAVKTINEHGGIAGRPLQLNVVDDASSADTAVSKANALVYTEGVKVIIGATLTASTDAAATVTNAAKVPQLARSQGRALRSSSRIPTSSMLCRPSISTPKGCSPTSARG